MHDVDLLQRLHLAESDLLTSMLDGTRMLASYHQTWSALPGELSAASRNGNIGQETLSLAHLVATRVSKIASCFLDIKRAEGPATAQLRSDCDDMLQQMGVLNLNAQPKPSYLDGAPFPPISLPTPAPRTETSNPPFLASAYQWLLDNLHNPYPTAEIKARLAATSSCRLSSINSWFSNARRRIGWTTLCRERFSNCRADMIDAAYRALVEEDPERALSPELGHAFVTVKVAAEGLYSSTFARTAFTEDLDAILRDVMKKGGDSADVGDHQVEPTNSIKAAYDSYPSPDRSITTSPATSSISVINDPLIDESEDDVAPPILAGSKRRRSSIDTVDQSSSPVRRSVKRLRASTSFATHLLSPPSSTDGFDISSDGDSSTLSPGHSVQPDTSSSRKRRLSDSESTSPTKRPCGSMAAPRIHTVSDPLPRSDTGDEQSFDDWFNANSDALFNIPPPVDATEPDSSSFWEVEIFKDYNIPGNLKCIPAAMTDTQLSAPHDLSDFDNLLQSIGGDSFIAPSGSVPPSNMTGVPYTASVDSLVPDFSQTNIDWTSFLNDPDVYQPTVYPQCPADPQTPLPEIDLPVLQLPSIAPAVSSQGDSASKQAKLDQLHAMQEAVRRMEQELQSEGVL